MYVCMYVCMYVVSSESFAQKTSVFEHDPKAVFGYAVLNPSEYPDLNQWKIVVSKREYLDSVNYVDTDVYSNTLVKLNYDKIPDNCFEYENGYFVLQAYGISQSGDVLVSEEIELTDMLPPGGHTIVPAYEWACVGDNYSWKIVGNVKEINGVITENGYLNLSHNNRPIQEGSSIGTPYYMYLTPEDYEAFTNTNPKWYAFQANHELYFMVDRNDLFNNETHSYKFIRLENVNSGHQLLGYYGQYVTGPVVYGVQKTKGPWNTNGNSPIQTQLDYTPNINGTWTLQHAMLTMNTWSDAIVSGTYPELICSGNSMPNPTAPTPNDHSRFAYCMAKVDWTTDFYYAY